MAEVYTSDLAQEAIEELPPMSREAVERAKQYLRNFPEMYPLIAQGEYRGKRRIPIRPYYLVLYVVYGEHRNCFVTDVLDARRRL